MLKLEQLALRCADPLLGLLRHVPFSVQRWVLQAAVQRLFAEPLEEGAFDLLSGRCSPAARKTPTPCSSAAAC